MAPEREPPERAILTSFKEKHPRIYSFLYQIILIIITFECAVTIARYGPERDDPAPAPAPASVSTTVPRTLLPRRPLPIANSTTPHICTYGAREDYVDLGPLTVGIHLSLYLLPLPSSSRTSIHLPNQCMHPNQKTQAITPYAALCPSTPFFLLSLLTYTAGIIKFNSMHKEDIWLAHPGYMMMFIMNITTIDWRNILVSLQIYVPINIWSASVTLAFSHWLFRMCFPRTYERLGVAWGRGSEKQRAKTVQRQRERDIDVEARVEGEGEVQAEPGTQGEVNEETPLRS
jgi:hypothetical protein